MPSNHKKVIVRRFLGDVIPGYLPFSSFVRHGSVNLLDLDGRIKAVNISDVKHISYVRDFNLADTSNPERITRRAFLARPRSEGLWLRLIFRSSASPSPDPRSPDLFEGLAAPDLSLFDDLLTDHGVHLTPPDTRSNTQRIFVPRSAIAELQVLAVITSAARRKPLPKPSSELQDDLFHALLPPNTRPN